MLEQDRKLCEEAKDHSHRCRYEMRLEFHGAVTHIFIVEGRWAAIHLHMRSLDSQYAPDGYTGGVEMHYKQPPYYMDNQPPSQNRCWILDAPCWHDGSSLLASEKYIPMFFGNNHDEIFGMLKADLDSRVAEHFLANNSEEPDDAQDDDA